MHDARCAMRGAPSPGVRRVFAGRARIGRGRPDRARSIAAQPDIEAVAFGELIERHRLTLSASRLLLAAALLLNGPASPTG
jgi:hypothetical protein